MSLLKGVDQECRTNGDTLVPDAATAHSNHNSQDIGSKSLLSVDSALHQQAGRRTKKSCYVRCAEGILAIVVIAMIAIGGKHSFWPARFCCSVSYFVVTGLMLYYLFKTDAPLHLLGWAISGIFVCVTVPISLHDLHSTSFLSGH